MDKEKDTQDQIIAFARHRHGKTLLVLANKDVNNSVPCVVKVPTLKENQRLDNLLPSYGQNSKFQISEGEIAMILGPGRIHVFEIDTPNIERQATEVHKQNL